MKVIEKSEGESRWTSIVQCTGEGNECENARRQAFPCGSKLEIDENDIFMTHHYCFDGSVSDYYTITCPCCGALTDLDKRIIPYNVRTYVEHKDQIKNGGFEL